MGGLYGAGDHLGLNGHILIVGEPAHHGLHTLAAKETHQIVLQGQVELALTGIALTTGTAAQLVVDTAGVVALGAQNVQAAGFAHFVRFFLNFFFILLFQILESLAGVQDLLIVRLGKAGSLCNQLIAELHPLHLCLGQELGVTAQHNIRTTTGHIGGDGHCAEFTGLGNNLCLALVVLGVKHIVLDMLFLQQLGQLLTLLNADGTHQHRLALFVAGLDLLDHGPELACLGLEDHIRVVHTDQRFVGGDLHHIQLVDFAELGGLGGGRTGHTGQLLVQTEVILEGNGGKSLALVLHLNTLFGLNRLVQTLVVATAQHNTAGEFVYDQHLTVLDHIVNIPAHDADGLDGLVNMVQQGGVLNIHQVVYMEVGLCFLYAVLGQGGGTGLLVYDKVAVIGGLGVLLLVHFGNLYHLQGAGKGVGLAIQVGGLLALTADDQGGTGLIDQDGVYLIYDGKHMAALHFLLLVLDHIVSQVVKAHLVVGAVGDVAVVGLLALLIGLFVNNQTYAQPQEPV